MARTSASNKLNRRDQRRIENIRERLRAQGIGEDEATRRAIEEVAKRHHSGTGGGRHSAGESKKPTKHGGRGRTGSRTSVSK